MDPKFWLNKWSSNQIGFHELDIHQLLEAWWPSLEGMEGDRVLVPLCGKSLDLLWLMERHRSVAGVEISEIAVLSFFEEQNLSFTKTEFENYSIFEALGIQIFCGDFFDIPPTELGLFDLVYDRASLVALSPSDRIKYQALLTKTTKKNSKMLLITVDYDAKAISPPPHIINDSMLKNIYCANWKLTKIDSQVADIKGVLGSEHCYRIERKARKV